MIASRIRQMTLVLLCLTSACGEEGEVKPKEKENRPSPQTGDLGANTPIGTSRPGGGGSTTSPTPPRPMPNRVKTALFFEANNLSPLESCIQTQLIAQSPDKLANGTISGPMTLTQDAGGKKLFANARFKGKDVNDQAQAYTLTFKTSDSAGWTKQIRNFYIGATGYGLDTKVDVASDATGTIPFVLDIASCPTAQ